MGFKAIDANGAIKESVLSSTLTVTEANISLSDVTTDNVTTTRHGFAPKAPNDATKYLDGTGAYAVPISMIYPTLTVPNDGSFSWVNQGGASVTVNSNGGIFLRAPVSATNNFRIRKITAPATPWTITAGFQGSMINLSSQAFGLVFRQSADGKLHGFFVNSSTNAGGANQTCGIFSTKFTNPTTFSADYQTRGFNPNGPIVWLRVNDSGVNRVCSYSADGLNFIQYTTIGRTDFLTADEVGFFANDTTNTYEAGVTLVSWAQT